MADIALAEAKIIDHQGREIAARAQITVRAGSATTRLPNLSPETRDDVESVDAERGTWRVAFADGTWWTVTRAKRGCGCRGGNS